MLSHRRENHEALLSASSFETPRLFAPFAKA